MVHVLFVSSRILDPRLCADMALPACCAAVVSVVRPVSLGTPSVTGRGRPGMALQGIFSRAPEFPEAPEARQRERPGFESF